ncbi:MAG: hypothetical protein BHV61_03635 [Collinsella sp. 60_9]|nr:MAG: hypothetical protein BHV61_03635 [Collinsella sp. 60_9]
MATPKISVVVPIYKVEECLAWCLDSLLAQDMPDWEGVLVNDGSPDGSRDIAAAYCDPRLQTDVRLKHEHDAERADSDPGYKPEQAASVITQHGVTPSFFRDFALELREMAVNARLRAGKRRGDVLYRALEQEDAALLERGDDLKALLGRQTVSGHAETRQLVCDGVLRDIADGVMEALGRDCGGTRRLVRELRLVDLHMRLDEAVGVAQLEDGVARLAVFGIVEIDAQHADDLAYFLCDLVLYDALRLLGSDCGKVFAAVATALAGSAVGSDVALAQCAPSVAAMVRAALASDAPSARACKKLMFDYDVLRFGRLGACKRMAANALGKREV